MRTVQTSSARSILTIVWIMAAAAYFRANSLNYVIGPAAVSFDLGGEGTQTFKLVPSIGQLLVVFLAGLLAERFGPRRTLAGGSLALAVGGALCTGSAGPVVMNIGLLVAAAGTTTLAVAGVALIGMAFAGAADRARAFGVVASAMPAVALVSPFICAWLSENVSWRAITAGWVLLGLIALAGALRGLGKDELAAGRDEYVTPLLAGMALVGFVQAINGFSDEGWSVMTVIYAGVMIGSLVGIVLAHRVMARTSLSLVPLRRRIPLLILVAITVVALASQWYVGFLAFQYLLGLSTSQIALAMIPTQLMAILSTRIVPRVIVAKGLRVTASVGMLLVSASSLLFLLVDAGQSAVVLASVMAVYGFVATGVGVSINNAAMNSLPREHSGAMSSFRSASGTLGGAMATVIMGTLLFAVYGASLDSRSAAAGVDSATASTVAVSLNAGVNEVDVSSQVAIPTDEVAEIDDLSREAMADALHAKSLASAVLAVAAAALLAAAIRRSEDEEGIPESASSASSR